jgi:hypothetical protein
MGATVHRRAWLIGWACAVYLLSAGYAAAQSPGQSTPEAKALLLGMAQVLATTERLSVTVRTAYDSVQPSGQKVEWNEMRTLTLRRPDRLRMEVERSNGARSLVVFDGKEISAFDEAGRSYAKAPQPGGMDETLVYFVRDLGMRLPLAVFFVSRSAAELERRVKSIQYVEKTGILGSPAHHLVGRTDTVNFQVWITDAEKPLLRRIVLTYPGTRGEPQFRADFSAWNLSAEAADSLFTFTPPADTRKVPFAAALSQYRAKPSAAGKTGARP